MAALADACFPSMSNGIRFNMMSNAADSVVRSASSIPMGAILCTLR